jgi:outer membrane lipoprotein-sorting protein
MSGTWRKWTPAVVAVVVVAGVAVAAPVAANASVSLPTKTPAQVIELAESSTVTAFSGDITETSDLGLPSLPASGTPSGASGADGNLAADLALLTGSNSLRVYVDGAKNIRLQDLGSLSEQDAIRHGNDVWTYDSKSNTVEHATLSSKTSNSKTGNAAPNATSPNQHWSRPGAMPQGANLTPKTPEGIADAVLAELAPTSTVSVSDNVRVAGRAAYDLVLTPKATDTLVGSVSIAVDAATGLPLQVQIAAAGQKDPAVSIGFTSLNLSKPDSSLFDFTVPKGAKVKQITEPKTAPTHPKARTGAAKPTETVTGKGWDAVVTVAATGSTSGSLGTLSSSPEFGELTTAVAGGRVLHTTLFNVLFTSDGRIVAGAVSIARLEAVAAQ